MSVRPSPSNDLIACPYVGLTPYSEEDADFFFGRERESRFVIADLYASRLTVLYGASGVGKSSILHAGVARRLTERENLLAVIFRAWQDDPVESLKMSINAAATRVAPEMRPPPDSMKLGDYLTHWAEQLDRRLVIILDQFEEYFLYHPLDNSFDDEFPSAVMHQDALLTFLISLREDSVSKLDRFEDRVPSLFDNLRRIEPLSSGAARDAIRWPIEQYNRRFAESGNHFSIEPELVEAVLAQVKTGAVTLGDSGRGFARRDDKGGHIEAPFLQLVMTRLWSEELSIGSRSLRLQTLNKLSGAESIVQTHLDDVMVSLPPDQQEIAANIFRFLVTPSGTKIALSVSDLAAFADHPQSEIAPVLYRLASGRFRIFRAVTPPLNQSDDLRYEIFHDVLASAVLDWRARYIGDQARLRAERLAAEEREEAESQARDREQARWARRLRKFIIISIALLLLSVGTAIIAAIKIREALVSRREALDARREAEFAQQKAHDAQRIAEKERERAEGLARAGQEAEDRAKVAEAQANEALREAHNQKLLAEKLLENAQRERAKAIALSREADAMRRLQR